MSPKDDEIRKIINGSELRDIADFLANPESKITDCILCYQTEDDIGYKALNDSSMATLTGLLELVKDQMRFLVDQVFTGEE